MKKPLINFKTARIIEIVSIVLMLILVGLTVLLELNKALLAVSIVGGLTVYVVAAFFDRCPHCGRNLDRVSLCGTASVPDAARRWRRKNVPCGQRKLPAPR